MKLKEQFEKEIENDGNSKVLLKHKCVKITKEFSINFAEWIDDYYFQGWEKDTFYLSEKRLREGESFTIKQLFDIYEKQLEK